MDAIEAQNGVVQAVVASFPGGPWQAAILDYEIRETTDGVDSDYVGIVLMKGTGGRLVQDQFFLGRSAREACIALYLQRKRDTGAGLAGFVLRLERPGSYGFVFKEALQRLTGTPDPGSEAYLDDYLSHYLSEKARDAG